MAGHRAVVGDPASLLSVGLILVAMNLLALGFQVHLVHQTIGRLVARDEFQQQGSDGLHVDAVHGAL